MNLLTCFEVVPDFDKMTDEDWEPEGLRVETGYVRKILNYFDESALELSLRLFAEAEAAGRPMNLTAMSIGGAWIDPFLKNLYALRFHRAVRLETDEDLRFAPRRLASLRAYFAREAGFDAMLMGGRSAEGDNAAIPFETAERLGWPCVADVTALRLADDGRLRCTSRTGGGMLNQTVRLPCVFAVTDAPGTALRIPTLKDKMRYGKREIEVLPAPSDTYAGEGFSPRSLERVSRIREGRVIGGDTPEEKARVLYKKYLAERMAPS